MFLRSITQGERNLLPLLTCCTCSPCGQQGGEVWGVINEFNTGRTELVAVGNVLHMPSCGQQGVRCGG